MPVFSYLPPDVKCAAYSQLPALFFNDRNAEKSICAPHRLIEPNKSVSVPLPDVPMQAVLRFFRVWQTACPVPAGAHRNPLCWAGKSLCLSGTSPFSDRRKSILLFARSADTRGKPVCLPVRPSIYVKIIIRPFFLFFAHSRYLQEFEKYVLFKLS